jgi:hypothetical protein
MAKNDSRIFSPKKVHKTVGEVHEKSSQTALTKFDSFIILTTVFHVKFVYTYSLQFSEISDFGTMQENNHYGTMLSDN